MPVFEAITPAFQSLDCHKNTRSFCVGPRYHLIFETDRFNVSQPKEHYINECCYGDDAAAWLRDRLAELDIEAGEPGDEDWGWYVYVFHDGNRYFVGITGFAEVESHGNLGEWRLMIEKCRSLKELITRKNRIVENEPIIGILMGIIDAQADMKLLGIEKQ